MWGGRRAGASMQNDPCGDQNSCGTLSQRFFDTDEVIDIEDTSLEEIEVNSDGLTEEAPILPDNDVDQNGSRFEFSGPFANNNADDTVWIDPPVATGYDYSVSNASFDTVTAPTQFSDTFTLNLPGETSQLLNPGQTVNLSNNPQTFSITDINTDLGLDPDNSQAFPTGITLTNQGQNITVTQTPQTTNVPVPETLGLLGLGLVGLGVVARRYPNC